MAKLKGSKQDLDAGFQFPIDRTNLLILAIGAVVVATGFVFMALPDHPDDPLTRTIAPLMLVIAFAVIIPYGIMYRKKSSSAE